MSPPPVRVDMKASGVPAGEYRGRDSSAGSEISKCASPPDAGTVQMSPPETNAISLLSGDNEGWASDGRDSGVFCEFAGTETPRASKNATDTEKEMRTNPTSNR